MFIRKWPQIAQPQMAADDVDDISSYGTGHSSEGRMQDTRDIVAATGEGDMGTLFAAIASYSRGQAILIDRLALLERAVGTVQFDMTWVRDDMKAAREALDRMAEHECDIGGGTAELERPREQVSVDASPLKAWTGKDNAADCAKPPSASTSRGDLPCGDDGVPKWNAGASEVGSHMEDIHALFNSTDTNKPSLTSTPVGRRTWGYACEEMPPVSSPQCQQPRVLTEKDSIEEESEQIEMSCQSTQLPTPMIGRSMWKDFAEAVRDWPAPSVAAPEREEGWVTAKKGRWDTTDYGVGDAEPTLAQQVEDIAALNFRLLLQRQGELASTRGPAEPEPAACIAGPSKIGGNGTGRGSGRGKRLPEVQPRYHTQVRGGWICGLIICHYV